VEFPSKNHPLIDGETTPGPARTPLQKQPRSPPPPPLNNSGSTPLPPTCGSAGSGGVPLPPPLPAWKNFPEVAALPLELQAVGRFSARVRQGGYPPSWARRGTPHNFLRATPLPSCLWVRRIGWGTPPPTPSGLEKLSGSASASAGTSDGGQASPGIHHLTSEKFL
jgi:hypothetical protein